MFTSGKCPKQGAPQLYSFSSLDACTQSKDAKSPTASGVGLAPHTLLCTSYYRGSPNTPSARLAPCTPQYPPALRMSSSATPAAPARCRCAAGAARELERAPLPVAAAPTLELLLSQFSCHPLLMKVYCVSVLLAPPLTKRPHPRPQA